jgi:hypothetical protein
LECAGAWRKILVLAHRLCGKKKCKAGAFIFPSRSLHSGQEPEGLKGGEPIEGQDAALGKLQFQALESEKACFF